MGKLILSAGEEAILKTLLMNERCRIQEDTLSGEGLRYGLLLVEAGGVTVWIVVGGGWSGSCGSEDIGE